MIKFISQHIFSIILFIYGTNLTAAPNSGGLLNFERELNNFNKLPKVIPKETNFINGEPVQDGEKILVKGFRLVGKKNGISDEQLLEVLKEQTEIDMILLDINMPAMNGIEFAKEQSKNEKICRIPTILVTTESHPKLAVEAKKTGVVKAWITKPVKPEILVSTIKRILEKLKGTY